MIWLVIYGIIILPTIYCFLILLKEGILEFLDFVKNTESLISVIVEFFGYIITFITLFLLAVVPFINLLIYFRIFDCEIKNPFYKGER